LGGGPKAQKQKDPSFFVPPPPDFLEAGYEAYLQAYGNKEAAFHFRGLEFRFALSQGLFSSADIDRGSRALLQVFSRLLDEDLAQGRPLPRRVLDSGSGIGVLGICTARTLAEAAGEPPLLRAQDRDELARIFTQGNGARNRLKPGLFQARAEALLDAGAGETWDLILSNVPAKAGEPVLRDFIPRSAALLAPEGRAIIVVVHTLADFFRTGIRDSGAPLLREEAGPEHRVFVYGAADHSQAGAAEGPEPRPRRASYLRNSASYEMEGIRYRISSVHGAAEFDRPGPAAETAAKLLCRLGADRLFPDSTAPLGALIHEGGQGHFPLWLLLFLEQNRAAAPELLLLHGRNILALEAAQDNIVNAGIPATPKLRVVPGVDLALDRDRLSTSLGAGASHAADGGDAGGREPGKPAGAHFIAAFPGIVPGTMPYGRIWEGLRGLLLPGGIAIISLPAAEADRLIKQKPSGFARLGDLKRRGFRALAFRRAEP
jgi:hypothetical protein